MDESTYTPATAASTIGVHPNVVRKWCIAFRDYLSPGCNPPSGQGRKLTPVDVGRLQLIRAWRSEGVEFNAIAPRLALLPPNEPATPYIDNAPMPAVAVTSTPESTPGAIVALHSLESRIAVLESNSATTQRRQWVMLAIVAGALVVGVILGAVIVVMVR